MTTSKGKRAAWRERNRERLRAYDRERASDPARAAKIRKRVADWRKENPEKAREAQRRWRERNKERVREAARVRQKVNPDRRRQKALGVSGAEFHMLFLSQGKRCAICGVAQSRRWNLDHDHGTGRVRGVLCCRCNLGIGLLQDSPSIAAAAANYLQHHRQLQELL